MLAKNVNDNAGFLDAHGVLWFFASKLAPTREGACLASVFLQKHRTPTSVQVLTA